MTCRDRMDQRRLNSADVGVVLVATARQEPRPPDTLRCRLQRRDFGRDFIRNHPRPLWFAVQGGLAVLLRLATSGPNYVTDPG